MIYYTYMLRCDGDELYTGITTDIKRRMSEHFSKNGAKYTRSHSAKKLEAVWESADRSHASRLEYRIKQLTKQNKEKLIRDNSLAMISGIEPGDYSRISCDVFPDT